MPKITHEREKCIGCGNCVALCSKYWEMTEDAKSTLIGSKLNEASGVYELDVEAVECNQEAPDSCPVFIINVTQ